MARINDQEASYDTPAAKKNRNHRPSFIDQLDSVPETELITKKDVLQLATHCCNVYDYWMNHQEEFSRDHDTRTKRRQTLLSLSNAARGDHEPIAKNIDDVDVVDLREYTDWFMNHNTDINLRFDSANTLNEAVNQQPETWFLFLRYMTHSLHYADLHIEAQNTEIDNLRTTNEDLCSSNSPATITILKKKKYRDTIIRLREEVEALSKERDNLKLSLERLNIQGDYDSDDEFLNQDTQKLTHTAVSKSAALIGSSCNGVGNNKPPDRMEVFDGQNRDKYDEWVDKFLGQIKTHENWFSNEDRKLTYLMRHLTSAPYNLLKPKYDERARAKPSHGRTLSGALTELDRAFRAYDMRRDAKTKLETLRMGNNESFGDFFAKFQIQINKLDYHDEDKIDELKARLNGRFASKIISGRKDTYEELVNQCYTLDSELKMYEAKKTTSSSSGSRYPGNLLIPKPQVDHATVELGKSFKPLSQMTLKELKDYRNSLPRSNIIKQRLIDEKRSHRCMQKGHTGSDQECQFNRLPPTENFKSQQMALLNQLSISEKGKDAA
ncbi:hypothetical protein HI914_06292 [Erysiphe necator]|nr:hypothetical protein HI914_06292 [Erysiphe necator]